MKEFPANEKQIEPLIAEAEPDFETHTVTLSWHNGAKSIADFSHLVGEGVFESFADPKFFNNIRLTHNGRGLSWANGIDFDSLLLWYTANPHTVPKGLSPFLPSKSHFSPKSRLIGPYPKVGA
jgi:hypothetical protein